MDPNKWEGRLLRDPPVSDTSIANKPGQKLLALIRFLENNDNGEEFEEKLEEAETITDQLIQTSARKGLLRGDWQKAKEILAGSNLTGTNPRQDNLKRKRTRRRHNETKIPTSGFAGESPAAASTTTTATNEESLVLTALLRIFGLNECMPQSTRNTTTSSALVLTHMAADLCTAISENAKGQSNKAQSSELSLAEFEVLSSFGIPLLRGLTKSSKHILSTILPPNLPVDHEKPMILFASEVGINVNKILALRSCLRAIGSLISLYGTRLSRSTGILKEVRSIGWTCLTIPDVGVQMSASRLLASVPLAGGSLNYNQANVNRSPAEQWSELLMDSVIFLSTILRTMVPVNQKMVTQHLSWKVSAYVDEFLADVIDFFQNQLSMDDEGTASYFRFLLHGISNLILSLLRRDYHGIGQEIILMDARISIGELLDLVETMTSFSYASESLLHKTKKRLRLEKLEGAILSPVSIVNEVAAYVKLTGHEIFVTACSALGPSPLLPHAKRILSFASSALTSCASTSLRKVVDPTFELSQSDMKRKWLHTSIPLRTVSIRSFTVAVSMFGLELACRQESGASTWVSSQNAMGVLRCISLVGGCLLEQIWCGVVESEDWGTCEENVSLLNACIKSLKVILESSAGYITLPARVLVDSIAAAGLQTISSSRESPILADSGIKAALIRLGSASLSTPWPTGASSSVLQALREASIACRQHDYQTGEAAAAASRFCDSYSTPRVPAMHIDSMHHDLSGVISANAFLLDVLTRRSETTRNKTSDQSDLRNDVKRQKVEENPTQLHNNKKKSAHKELVAEVKIEKRSSSQQADTKGVLKFPDNRVESQKVDTQKMGGIGETEKQNTEKYESEDEFFPDIAGDDGPDEEDE